MTSGRAAKGIVGGGLGVVGLSIWVFAAYSAATVPVGSALGVIFGAALAMSGLAFGFAAFAPAGASREIG